MKFGRVNISVLKWSEAAELEKFLVGFWSGAFFMEVFMYLINMF